MAIVPRTAALISKTEVFFMMKSSLLTEIFQNDYHLLQM
jgi:hypothetical protein